MKKLMTTLLVVLLGWTGLCFADATVTGTVQCVPSDGGTPNSEGLTGTVTLWQNDAATSYTADINNGGYTIANVPAGTYTAKFVGNYQGNDCAGDSRLSIANDATNETCNITARITITAVTISGNITIENPDNAESPIAGGVQSGTVSLWQNGEKKHEGNVTTADNVSSYTLSAAPGTYTLAFDGTNSDNKILFHKAYEFTVPTTNRPYDFMATVNTTGVAVSGAITHVESDQTYGDIGDGTVQLLQGNEVKAEITVEKTGNTAYYAFSNIEAGTYTLSFIGTWHNQLVVKTVESVTVGTANVTQDIQADIDETRGYTTINVHYGELQEGWYGPEMVTKERIANAKVTLTPTSGDPMVATSDANGTVKFLVAKNADLTYTLKIEPQEKYKDTTITSFVAYGDNGHGGNDFKTVTIYVQKIPLPTVKVSGNVTLNGQKLNSLPGEDLEIGLKNVEGKLQTAKVENGQYTFESVPVDGNKTTLFFIYDPNGKYDYDLQINQAKSYRIKSPENCNIVLTENENGITQDLDLERIAINVSGTINVNDIIRIRLEKKGDDGKYAYSDDVQSTMDGKYTFKDVQLGEYQLVVDIFGYEQKVTPTFTVTSLENDMTLTEEIVLEAVDVTFTFENTMFYAYNPYTGGYPYLAGAKIELWSVDENGQAKEKLTETTAASEAESAKWSMTTTGKVGTRYIVRITHPDIEDYETTVEAKNSRPSVDVNNIRFKYDGPTLDIIQDFKWTWNAAKDSLILSWKWLEAVKNQENYKIGMVGLSRKQAEEAGNGAQRKYWNAEYNQETSESVFAFDDLPVTFTDSAKDGSHYLYTFAIQYSKPVSMRYEEIRFTIDLRPDYTLTYAANEAALGTVKSQTASGSKLKAGDLFQLIALPAEDCRFKEWKDAAQDTTLGKRDTLATFMPAVNYNIQAVFEQYRFTISVAADDAAHGEVAIEGTATKFELGESVTVKATPKAGYRFVSWKEGETVVSTQATYTFKAEKNRSLTAVFEEVKYVLGLGVNNTEWGKVEGAGEFKAGTEVTAKAIANEGYKFVAWTEGEEEVSTEANYTFKLEKDRTLTAVFEDATTYYTVTLQANNAEWGKVEGGDKYAAGANATVKATANKDYHFVAWMEGETKVSEEAVYTFKVEKDITLTAVFAEGAANEELEAALWTVYAENGTIVIKGLSGDRYSVYDLNGRLAGQALCTGAEIRIDVAPNKLYIVRRVSAAGLFGAKKIVVR